eukprot:12125802-Karenia_brevis.AAC.1
MAKVVRRILLGLLYRQAQRLCREQQARDGHEAAVGHRATHKVRGFQDGRAGGSEVKQEELS